MTCTTCGRDNPSHLTFCQECGQRLGPRIAPPTPPIGLGGGADAYGAPAAVDASRPAGRSGTAVGGVLAPASPTPAGGDRRCKICDTMNGPNLRYCTSCGSTLEAARPATTPTAGAQEIPVNRVVEVAAPTATPSAGRVCPRCRGIADGNAQFCKFCGNNLADAAPTDAPPAGNGAAAARPPTAPIAAAPAAQVQPRPVDALRPAPVPSAGLGGPAAPGPMASAVPQPPVERAAAYGPPPGGPTAGIPRPASVPPPARAAAAPTQRGRLVVIAKSGADGPSYPFGDLLDIGRSEGNVIVAEDPYLSPRHVRIVWHGGKLVLRDLGSTNGVFLRLSPSRDTSTRRVEGETAVPLVDHDVVLVGQQVLRFDILKDGEGAFGPAQEHGTLLFGSPAAPRYARLSQRTVEGIARDVYYIRKPETVLGRESGDVVFTEDPFLSRRHAAVRVLSRDGASPGGSRPPGETRFALVDLGSSNGTFLRIRGDVDLVPGDHFRVGQQLFRVDFDGARGA